jgi:hypothetical protein
MKEEGPMSTNQEIRGFQYAGNYPLLTAIFHRRTRRVSKGVASVAAGKLSYPDPEKPPPRKPEPEPLTALEEALLIGVTGATGITMPDRPFELDNGEDILGSPNLYMGGRSAASPDNAQATHFILINDEGTYFLKRLTGLDRNVPTTPESLIERAQKSKHLLMEGRIDLPRRFPYYLDSNRFLSNLKGTTILLPIVDMTRQYINGLLYLLTQPDGTRPAILDDRNFYLPAGVGKWIRNGFLNRDIPVPLGTLGTFRTDIEAYFLLQNLFLTTQAMGLGGWIHAAFASPYLFGHPMFRKEIKGLGFRYQTPKFRLGDLFRWGTFLPKPRANPVGLDGVIEGMCPPYYESMSDAVDAILESKYGPNGTYKDPDAFEKIFKDDFAKRYLEEVPHYREDTIACVKDICNYIYEKHRRFPAHVDAFYVPGIWLQAHHLNLDYYDYLFREGYSESHRVHDEMWHGADSGEGGARRFAGSRQETPVP